MVTENTEATELTETEAVETNAPENTEQDANDLFDHLFSEVQAEENQEEETEEEEQTLAKPAKDLFSDEALSTPEGIRAAKEAVRKIQDEAIELKKKHDKTFLKLHSREKKFNDKFTSFKNEQQLYLNDKQNLLSNLKLLQEGNDAQVLQVLSQLTGRDPVKFVEGMNSAILGIKKPDENMSALQKEILELKNYIQNKEKKAEEDILLSQAQNQISEAQKQIVSLASDAQAYPNLSIFAKENPGEVAEVVTDVITQYYIPPTPGKPNTGRAITFEQALEMVEEQLAANNITSRLEGRKTPANGKNSEMGREPINEPEAMVKQPKVITNSHISQNTTTKDLTENELYERARQNPDAWLSEVGLGSLFD